MQVQPGHLINIPQADIFFVHGPIDTPRSYPLSHPHTLTQALAVAGGATPTLGHYSSVAFFRSRDAGDGEVKGLLVGTEKGHIMLEKHYV
jgi:protein involved in polysaccharide export with SLBB domain